nr:MAG TPA: hypothetical protein [Caudoviricetes sp.]
MQLVNTALFKVLAINRLLRSDLLLIKLTTTAKAR